MNEVLRVPVTVRTVTHIIVRDATDDADARAKALAHWKKHYDDPEEPCLIEGAYVKGTMECTGPILRGNENALSTFT